MNVLLSLSGRISKWKSTKTKNPLLRHWWRRAAIGFHGKCGIASKPNRWLMHSIMQTSFMPNSQNKQWRINVNLVVDHMCHLNWNYRKCRAQFRLWKVCSNKIVSIVIRNKVNDSPSLTVRFDWIGEFSRIQKMIETCPKKRMVFGITLLTL